MIFTPRNYRTYHKSAFITLSEYIKNHAVHVSYSGVILIERFKSWEGSIHLNLIVILNTDANFALKLDDN